MLFSIFMPLHSCIICLQKTLYAYAINFWNLKKERKKRSIFLTVFTIKGPKGASEARARGLFMVKTVNKYTLNSLVSDLFCERQRM